MKKIFIIIALFLVNISYAQLHIGPVMTLRDSSGTAVLSGTFKTWGERWVKPKDVDSSLAGTGLAYSRTTGLNVNVGSGIYIQNDTLKASVFINSFSDSMTVSKQNVSPFLRFTNTNSNQGFIKLNEQNLLRFETNNVVALEGLESLGDLVADRDVYALSNFKIGDVNSSIVIADQDANLFAKQLHSNDVVDAVGIYFDSDITTSKGFDGGSFTPSSESYFGDGSSLMTGPAWWLKIDMDGTSYLIPLYTP